MAAKVKVIIRPDGPLQVTGEVVVENLDGTPIELVQDEKGIFLCRCGRSGKKPFCDGEHKRSGWREKEAPETTERAGSSPARPVDSEQ